MATEGASNVQVYMQVEVNGEAAEGNSIDTKNHDGWCDVNGFAYELARNADKTGGMVTGKAFQGEFSVRKPIDKATPMLMDALAYNKEVKVVLELWRDKPKGGGREHFFTIELIGGRIQSLRPEANPSATTDSNNPYTETVSFVGEKIILTYTDGGIVGEYNFRETE